MKFLCTLKNALLIIRDHFGLSFASKGLGYLAALLLLLPLLARYKLSCYQTTLLLIISALADITLLKTTCHFLLLVVGFDTLTYRKGYNWSHILVGHHRYNVLSCARQYLSKGKNELAIVHKQSSGVKRCKPERPKSMHYLQVFCCLFANENFQLAKYTMFR